jgi:glycosyltransferase involved in cell wall biosynthesis
MFKVTVPSFSYKDPWDIPFINRLSTLKNGSQSIAYYYDYPDNSTFRYRVYNMIQALSESSRDVSAAFFSYKDINYLDQVVDLADVLVICRARYTHFLNRAITKARNKGKRVFFDVDDLVFMPAYTHFLLETLNQDLDNPKVWDFWFGYIGRQNATMELCERVITTNSFLGSISSQFQNKPTAIIPNFLNKEQIDISNKIFQEKVTNKFTRNETITLGYFSGTPSHNKDLQIISDALVEILNENPTVNLRVVGYIDLKPPLNHFTSRIQLIGLQDFINLQRLIGEVEINLVPLQENIFTNCKSELKYFEAGVVGTLTIASPIYSYSRAIRCGENGFIAKSYEWYEKINTVIQLIQGNYPVIAQNAYEDSIKPSLAIEFLEQLYRQSQTIWKFLSGREEYLREVSMISS